MASRRPVVSPLLYVYGFAECAHTQGRVAGAGPGVEEGVPVEWRGHGDIAAIVSPVPVRQYDETPLAAHVLDPAWLIPRAERHVQVLVRQMGEHGVVPCRFGTVYRDREGIAGFIDLHREPLRAALLRVRGTAEWAVKAYVRVPLVEEASSGRPGAQPGTAYFQGLLRHRAEQREAEAYAPGSVEGIRAALLKCASRVADLPLRDHGPAPRTHLHLNLACLVPLPNTSRFLASLARLAMKEKRRGVELVSSGPWPPYSFVADLFPASRADVEVIP